MANTLEFYKVNLIYENILPINFSGQVGRNLGVNLLDKFGNILHCHVNTCDKIRWLPWLIMIIAKTFISSVWSDYMQGSRRRKKKQFWIEIKPGLSAK